MKLSKSAQNSVLLIAEKVLVIGFAFIVSILLARIGGPELFGQYAYVTSFATLFSPLCIMGLNNIVTKYVIRYPNNSHYYVKSALVIRLIGALCSILVGNVAALYFNNDPELGKHILLLLIFQAFNALLIYEYFFLAHNRVLNTLSVRLAVLTVTNTLKIITIYHSASLTNLVLIQCAELLLIGTLYHVVYRKENANLNIKRALSYQPLLAMFHKGKWLLLSGLAAIIYMKIDQIMIANMVGNNEVAYYAAAAKLSEFWYVFPILIANAYNPQIISTAKRSPVALNRLLTKMLSALIGAALLISLVTLFFSNEIIFTIYGEQYEASATILSIHIFASIFIFQRALLSKWLILNNYLSYSLITTGVGATINILLNLYLIPKMGGIGAAWATLVSYSVASFFSLLVSSKTRPFAKLMMKAMLTWPFVLTKRSH